MIGDALIPTEKGQDWQFVLLEQHVEDEFTQGVFETAKFDRLSLTKGVFTANFIFRYRIEDEKSAFVKALDDFKKLAETGLIPIGGNRYRGQGALTWVITDDRDSFKSKEAVE